MLSILIVDHHGNSAAELAQQLFERGFDARSARTGEEAMQVTNGFQPDVAFIALGLPQENGFELAREFGADAMLAKCRLVALTVHDCPEFREAAKAMEFCRYLKLPIDIDIICSTIAELMEASS